MGIVIVIGVFALIGYGMYLQDRADRQWLQYINGIVPGKGNCNEL